MAAHARPEDAATLHANPNSLGLVSEGGGADLAAISYVSRGFDLSPPTRRLASGAPGRPVSVADPSIAAALEAGYETVGLDALASPVSINQIQTNVAAMFNEVQAGGDDWVIVEDMPMIYDNSIIEGGIERVRQPNSALITNEELPTLVTLLEFVSFIMEG